LNIDDARDDIEEYYKSGDKNYASALDLFLDKTEELEYEIDDIGDWKDKCYELQTEFNDKWSKYPNINMF